MNHKHRICMVVCSHYPQDPRVRREAEALVDDGHTVDVICLRKQGEAARGEHNGVGIYRLPMDRKRAGKVRYVYDYALFMLLAGIWLSGLHLRRGYRCVHVHNMPDVLVFTALLPRLTGARIVLDLHDPTPEVYQTKFGISPGGRAFRFMVACEQWSMRFVHQVLTANLAFRDKFVERGCPSGKIEVILNSPYETIFEPERKTPPPGGGGLVMMFHGGVYERHGLETALRAVAGLRGEIPGLRFEVYGGGDYEPRFLELVRELGLEELVHYHGVVTQEVIAEAIRGVDIGIIPNLRTPFTELNLPTRIFEYLCLDRPVIAPSTLGVRDYFGPGDLYFFEPGDVGDLQRVLREFHAATPAQRAGVLARGTAIYQQHTWENESRRLKEIFNRLL